MENLIRLLREARARGLTSKVLAAKLGVSPETVRVWAEEGKVPSADKMPQIADALGLSLDELYGLPRKAGREITGDEWVVVRTLRVLGVEPWEAVRAMYDLPRSEPAPDPTLIQDAAFNFSPPEDPKPTPADRDDQDAGNRSGRRP